MFTRACAADDVPQTQGGTRSSLDCIVVPPFVPSGETDALARGFHGDGRVLPRAEGGKALVGSATDNNQFGSPRHV